MRYILVVLMIALYLLNIADYTTTIYALNNIPNTLEANPALQTPDALFRLKIVYGTILGVISIITSSLFERLRQQDPLLFIDVCYFAMLLIIFTVIFQYFWRLLAMLA